MKRILTATTILDETSGLSYRITAVMTEPNEEAKKILKEREDMIINYIMSQEAEKIADSNKNTTYEDAVWEMVARKKIDKIEAIKLIDEYNHKDAHEQLEMVIKLRDNGIFGDTDIANISAQLRKSLPCFSNQRENNDQIENENKDTSGIDELFE